MFDIDPPEAIVTPDHFPPRESDPVRMTSGLSLVSPSSLHYAASPLQRQVAPASVNGIATAENEAVKRLSNGRVDLHGIGASLQRVPASDPRLIAVGARSYARGHHALIGSEADRGHELWHLAQQSMGRVRGTVRIQGQSVNAQASLEQEADRLGAIINRCRPAARQGLADAVSDRAPGNEAAPIQRKVTKFAAVTKRYVPPVGDLIATLDPDYFNESKNAIETQITKRLNDPKRAVTVVPSHIEATIGSGGTSPSRKAHKSSVVGQIGTDEFFLRSGGTYEAFEGGHLIPHEVWSTTDKDVGKADDYENLVPMSRTLNVSLSDEKSWRNIEKKIIEAKKPIDVKIDITRSDYDISYTTLATLFNLTLKGGKNGGDTIKLYNWIPESIEAEKNSVTMGAAVENPLRDLSTAITTTLELVAALKKTPLWNRINPTLQGKIQSIV